MKIYLAGPYDGDNVIEILGNVRRGIEAAADLMRRGHAVYCPFLDFLIGLMPGPQMPKATYQKNSLAFVEWCDKIVLLPGWELSGGALRELHLAKDLGKAVEIYEAAQVQAR